MTRQRQNIIISLVAGFLLLILCGNNLGAQGLYFDELHQATASFAYTGKTTPNMFASLTINNYPIMNMNYSGAIKTTIYGLYMRIFHQSFGVISWRLLGILFSFTGLIFFGVILRKKINPLGLTIFYFLILTDNTVLLTSRHDWGPTAMALFLRLLLLAIWLKGETTGEIRSGNTFILVFLLMISLFEKLSNVVLIIPIIFLIFINPAKRNISHILSAGIGGILGGLPLILANGLSFYQSGKLISTLSTVDHKIISLRSIIYFFRDYMSLGAGADVQSFILDVKQITYASIELISISAIIILIFFVALRHESNRKQLKTISNLFVCYFLIFLQLYFLPKNISVHHWIIGTPFQYLAITLFFSGVKEKTIILRKPNYRVVVIVLFVVFLLSRIIGLISMENSLSRGDSSILWDISHNQFAQFADSRSNDAFFLLADWGEGNQMVCFMNGKDESILQAFWDYGTLPYLFNSIINSSRKEVYLIFPVHHVFLTPEEKLFILDEANLMLSPEWELVPVELEIGHLRSMEIIKYQRITQP